MFASHSFRCSVFIGGRTWVRLIGRGEGPRATGRTAMRSRIGWRSTVWPRAA